MVDVARFDEKITACQAVGDGERVWRAREGHNRDWLDINLFIQLARFSIVA